MASLRKYATIEDVEQYADITSTDDTEFEDRISQSEELIDAYVGFQEKAVSRVYTGRATGVNSLTITDDSSDTPMDVDDNFFSYCVVEIIGGAGMGQQRPIASSSRTGKSITVATAFDVAPNSTSVYKIFQLGKFPRLKDVWHDSDNLSYHKSIPEAVKRAVAAQMAFLVSKGDAFFSGDGSEMESESIGNYSYKRGGKQGGDATASVKMVGPRTRALLKGYKNSTGRLIAENPTCL